MRLATIFLLLFTCSINFKAVAQTRGDSLFYKFVGDFVPYSSYVKKDYIQTINQCDSLLKTKGLSTKERYVIHSLKSGCLLELNSINEAIENGIIATRIGDSIEGIPRNLFYSHDGLAILYLRKEQYENAIEESQKALKHINLLEHKGNKLVTNDKLIAYNNLAFGFQNSGNFEQALRYYSTGLKVAQEGLLEKKEDSLLFHVILGNKGYVKSSICACDQGLDDIQTAIQFKGWSQDSTSLCRLHFFLGNRLNALGETDNALIELRTAEKIALTTGASEISFDVLLELANIYSKEKDAVNLEDVTVKLKDLRTKFIQNGNNYDLYEQLLDLKLEKHNIEKDALLSEVQLTTSRSQWMLAFAIFGLIAGTSFILFALNRNKIIRRQKSKIDRDYNELKEFSENASHEIQTPVAVIHAKLEKLLNSPNLSENEITDIDTVAASAERVSKLNRALLLLAKIDNNQFSLLEVVRAHDIIKENIQQLEDLISANGLKINYELSETNLTGSNLLFQMLISNLLSNAIKYNVENGIIDIDLQNGILFISNTGKPLKTTPEHLFERFAKDVGQEGGTGLGLAIVKKVCDAHGWHVRYTYDDPYHTLMVNFTAE